MSQDTAIYTEQAFVGRGAIVQQIVELLTSPDADVKRERSLIVEGPAGRGKSWLLAHTYQLLQRLSRDGVASPRVLACLFEASKDFSNLGDSEQRWHPAIARICVAMRDILAPVIAGWPVNLIESTASNPTGEKASESFAAHIFENYASPVLLAGLLRQAEENNLQIILIIDSLEAIPEAICADLESSVLAPLMRSTQVRLITSRRVDSRSHDWRKYAVRNQTRQIPLPALDAEFTSGLSPVIQQIDQLITAQRRRADPSSEPTLDLIHQQRDTLLQQARPHYSWGNPGINSCLVSKATSSFLKPQLTPADVEHCLRRWLRGPRTILSPQDWDEQFVFGTLDLLVTQYGSQLEHGVLRTEVSTLLKMDMGQSVEFLAYLQDLGIGLLNRDGSFSVHTEFVQLFSWLNSELAAEPSS